MKIISKLNNTRRTAHILAHAVFYRLDIIPGIDHEKQRMYRAQQYIEYSTQSYIYYLMCSMSINGITGDIMIFMYRKQSDPHDTFRVIKTRTTRRLFKFKNLSDRNKQRVIKKFHQWWNSLSYHEQVRILQ